MAYRGILSPHSRHKHGKHPGPLQRPHHSARPRLHPLHQPADGPLLTPPQNRRTATDLLRADAGRGHGQPHKPGRLRPRHRLHRHSPLVHLQRGRHCHPIRPYRFRPGHPGLNGPAPYRIPRATIDESEELKSQEKPDDNRLRLVSTGDDETTHRMSGPKNPPPQPQVSPSSPTKTNLCKIPSADEAVLPDFADATVPPPAGWILQGQKMLALNDSLAIAEKSDCRLRLAFGEH